MFRGTENLIYENRSTDWGFETPTWSNGTACADLDNDGDLDIVVNNINEPAAIYKNNSVEKSGNHFLDVQLKGTKENPFAVGAKVLIKQKNELQLNYITTTKGFESSSLQYVHFGLKEGGVIDTVQVVWPDGKLQTLLNVKPGQRIIISYHPDINPFGKLLPSADYDDKLFTDITASVNLDYKHRENSFNDFTVQPLMPHSVSTQGPKLAVADVNNDGLDDFYVCGAKYQPGQLFVQTAGGKFSNTNEKIFAKDSSSEDVNAVFFDADGDGDKDLYVVSGGNESEKDSANLDRLYINEGKGNFKKSTQLPFLFGNKSVAIAADFDHDGDMDLFVGGRVVAGRYGDIPMSYLLLNDGQGKFSIAGDATAAGLQKIGMVTDAEWADLDKDGWPELVIVGEWMPITIFKNEKGKLTNATATYGLTATKGLWNTLKVTDINGDGFDDILAGNLGVNSKLHGNEKFPLVLYVGDMDGNGDLDQLMAVEKLGNYYPFVGKEELENQLPSLIKKKYLGYASFAGQTMLNIFGEKLDACKKILLKPCLP